MALTETENEVLRAVREHGPATMTEILAHCRTMKAVPQVADVLKALKAIYLVRRTNTGRWKPFIETGRDVQQLILSAMQARGGEPMGPGEIGNTIGVRGGPLYNALTALVEQERLVKAKKGQWTLYSVPRSVRVHNLPMLPGQRRGMEARL